MAQESAKARISALLDENSFVEIGSMVTARATDFSLTDAQVPGDGVITGYGVIDGHLVYVYSQDASVLGGSIGEMHGKKISKVYEMAMKVGAPVIGLLDCAGLRLQEATDALNAFGEIYAAQAKASGVIPQLTAVFGNCGGGLTAALAMSDITFMENSAKVFVNSPNTLDGNSEAKCDTASAKYQTEETGLVDFAGTEQEVLGTLRQLVSILPANNEEDLSQMDSTDDLNRGCDIPAALADNGVYVATQISDNGFFVELKKDYGKDAVTGFVRLGGNTVGYVANNKSKLTAAGCEKIAEFVTFCDAFNIPVVTFTAVEGFEAKIDEEKKLAKAMGKLTYSFANATVPKINVVAGTAMASAYVAMNSKGTGADMVFAYPTAAIGTMAGKEAARIMCAAEIEAAEDKVAAIDKIAAEYDALQNSVTSAAKRGYVDAIIEPVNTRKYLIGTLEMLYTKSVIVPDKKHGTV